MVMSRIFSFMVLISILSALLQGKGSALSTALTEGAQSGITLSLSMAGSLCLWSGIGKLMEQAGLTAAVSRLIRPLLQKVFPSTRTDAVLAGQLFAQELAHMLLEK